MAWEQREAEETRNLSSLPSWRTRTNINQHLGDRTDRGWKSTSPKHEGQLLQNDLPFEGGGVLPVLECERRRWPARSSLPVLRPGGELGWMSRNGNEAERDGCSSSWSVDQNHYKPEHPRVFGPSLISHLSTATLRQSGLCSCLCFGQRKKIREQRRSESPACPVCHRLSDGRVNVLRQPNPDKHTQQTTPRPANHPRTNSQNDADCFKDFKKKYTTDKLIKPRREWLTHICPEKVESDVSEDVGFSHGGAIL